MPKHSRASGGARGTAADNAGGYDVLDEVERLRQSVEQHDFAIERLQQRRKEAKSEVGNPLVNLLTIVLITALLTSSCSLHAGDLLGTWDMEGLITSWTTPLEGIVAWAEEIGTFPYVIAAVITAIINFPVMICYMFTTPLRIIAGLLEMYYPKALTYVPYVEIGLIALTFLWLLRLGRDPGRKAALKAKIREIDGQVREHRTLRRQESDRLRTLEASPEYARAKAWQDTLKHVYDHMDEYEASFRRDFEECLPHGLDASKLDRYYNEDSAKARLVAEALKHHFTPFVIYVGISGQALTEQEYLDEFDRYYRTMSKKELYAEMGISPEIAEGFGVSFDE